MSLLETAQLLGNFGEFFGAIAVVATLIYLSVQIRQNTAATQATSRDSVAKARQDFLLRIGSDAATGELFHRGLFSQDSLEPREQLRFGMLIYAMFEQHESAYSQWKSGVLADTDWAKSEKIIRDYLAQPGAKKEWGRLAESFSKEFRDFVESLEPGRRWIEYDSDDDG